MAPSPEICYGGGKRTVPSTQPADRPAYFPFIPNRAACVDCPHFWSGVLPEIIPEESDAFNLIRNKKTEDAVRAGVRCKARLRGQRERRERKPMYQKMLPRSRTLQMQDIPVKSPLRAQGKICRLQQSKERKKKHGISGHSAGQCRTQQRQSMSEKRDLP